MENTAQQQASLNHNPEGADDAGESREPLAMAYDKQRDIITIGKTSYSGDFFRVIDAPKKAELYRLIRREEDGATTFQPLGPALAVEAEKQTFGPDDVVVIKVSAPISVEEATSLKAAFLERTNAKNAVVIAGSIQFAVIAPPEPGSVLAATLPDDLDLDEFDHAMQTLRAKLGGSIKIVALPPGVAIEQLTPDALAAHGLFHKSDFLK